MKYRQGRRPLLLLLLTTLVPVSASPAPLNALSFDSPFLQAANPPSVGGGSALRANPVGTEHAPVDGKDGMPHEGPWIETQTDRSRKKYGDTEDTPLSTSITDRYGGADLPKSNDGVMDDPGRTGPAVGTRGTEGGVTQKLRDTTQADKIPDAPKDAPPMPQSEVERLWKGSDDSAGIIPEEKTNLAKPDDLPGQTPNIPPEDASSQKDPNRRFDESTYSLKKAAADESAVIQPLHSLFLSFTMIIFSEIGDKTFLVAALMAMRHDRIVVFTAAFSALITMTVLSAVLGHAVPTLIPKSITNFLAAGLFLVFGIKMVFEARKMSPDEGVSEEMKEVEMELEEKEHQQRRMNRRRSSISPYILEAGRGVRKVRPNNGRLPSPPESPSSSSSRDSSPSRHSTLSNMLAGINNLVSLLLSPAWVQTFVMTFLGEWGDRSQIATIAMAAGQDYWWVTAGALVGHGLCTGAAVLGGKAIAGRVSMRTVTMGGAIAFLVFGFIYLFEAIY